MNYPVMRYVRWDIKHNGWFCAGPVLMAQGDKGVSIGGFLSAQQMIFWAISKERKLFRHPIMHDLALNEDPDLQGCT